MRLKFCRVNLLRTKNDIISPESRANFLLPAECVTACNSVISRVLGQLTTHLSGS